MTSAFPHPTIRRLFPSAAARRTPARIHPREGFRLRGWLQVESRFRFLFAMVVGRRGRFPSRHGQYPPALRAAYSLACRARRRDNLLAARTLPDNTAGCSWFGLGDESRRCCVQRGKRLENSAARGALHPLAGRGVGNPQQLAAVASDLHGNPPWKGLLNNPAHVAGRHLIPRVGVPLVPAAHIISPSRLHGQSRQLAIGD